MRGWFAAALFAPSALALPACSIRDAAGCCEGGDLPAAAIALPAPAFTFSLDGAEAPVYRFASAGGPSGPPVLLLHELPGFSPECARFAHLLASEGFTVYVPLLFGAPRERATLRNLAGLLCSRSWTMIEPGETSPIAGDLRPLCRRIAHDHGGARLGAIGMCLSGLLPLALLGEDSVVAPVVLQPSIPLLLGRSSSAGDLGLSLADLEVAVRRLERDDLDVYGSRFELDTIAPAARFHVLGRLLGRRFVDRTIAAREYDGPVGCIPADAHATMTVELCREPGHPTWQRFQEIVAFLHQRIG